MSLLLCFVRIAHLFLKLDACFLQLLLALLLGAQQAHHVLSTLLELLNLGLELFPLLFELELKLAHLRSHIGTVIGAAVIAVNVVIWIVDNLVVLGLAPRLLLLLTLALGSKPLLPCCLPLLGRGALLAPLVNLFGLLKVLFRLFRLENVKLNLGFFLALLIYLSALVIDRLDLHAPSLGLVKHCKHRLGSIQVDVIDLGLLLRTVRRFERATVLEAGWKLDLVVCTFQL